MLQVVKEFLDSQKGLKVEFKTELLELLANELNAKQPSRVTHPPRVDANGLTSYWCRWHERYEVADHMVISNNKSKGYCKASISLWNKRNSAIKKLNSQVAEAVGSSQFELATELNNQVEQLKAELNDPATFDYDRDWAAFNS